MDEQHRAPEEGSPVDGAPDNQSPPPQMDVETTQQAAASGSVQCPNCGSFFTPKVDEVAEEAKEEKVRPEQVRLQVDVDPETLKKLRDVMSKSYKYSIDTDILKECIMKTSTDPDKLLQLLKIVEDLHEKAEKGKKNSEKSASWRSWPKPKAMNLTARVYTVKVHSVTTGRTSGADKEILEKVKNMRWSTTQVEITDCQQCDIIIVFCPITSRVGADVPAAMNKAPGNKPVILVLMHHTRDDDYSTDVKKWSETCQNVLLDVHVLFHETQPGLLKCPRNDEAVQQIQEELKAHSKWRWSN